MEREWCARSVLDIPCFQDRAGHGNVRLEQRNIEQVLGKRQADEMGQQSEGPERRDVAPAALNGEQKIPRQ